MFLFDVMPDGMLQFFAHGLVLLGITMSLVGVFARFIPIILAYRLPIQIVGGIVLLFGVYFTGGYNNEEKWRKKVEELEKKVDIAEKKSKETNIKVERVFVDKIRYIERTKVVTKEAISKAAPVIDPLCKVDKAVVTIHNDSIKNLGEAK